MGGHGVRMRRALIAAVVVAVLLAALVGGIGLSTGSSDSEDANPIQRLIGISGDEDEDEPDENEAQADEGKPSRGDGEGESAGDDG